MFFQKLKHSEKKMSDDDDDRGDKRICSTCILLRGSEHLDDADSRDCEKARFIEQLTLTITSDCKFTAMTYVFADGEEMNALKGHEERIDALEFIVRFMLAPQLVEMEQKNIENRVRLHYNGEKDVSIAQFLTALGYIHNADGWSVDD